MPEEPLNGDSITISVGGKRPQLDPELGDKIVARQRRHQSLLPTIRPDSVPMARLWEAESRCDVGRHAIWTLVTACSERRRPKAWHERGCPCPLAHVCSWMNLQTDIESNAKSKAISKLGRGILSLPPDWLRKESQLGVQRCSDASTSLCASYAIATLLHLAMPPKTCQSTPLGSKLALRTDGPSRASVVISSQSGAPELGLVMSCVIRDSGEEGLASHVRPTPCAKQLYCSPSLVVSSVQALAARMCQRRALKTGPAFPGL
ncbi:hypothetical protein V8C26DRAFT_8531 [Trichoderma gracile]